MGKIDGLAKSRKMPFSRHSGEGRNSDLSTTSGPRREIIPNLERDREDGLRELW